MAIPQVTIDLAHQKGHEGKNYTVNYLEKAVVNNGYIRLRFVTPSNVAAHIIFELASEGKAYFKTYSGTTYTADGTLPDGVNLTQFSRSGADPSVIVV